MSVKANFIVPDPEVLSELDAISKWEKSFSISIGPPGGMGKSIFKMGATLILKTKSFFSKISFPEPPTGFFTEPD